MTEAAARERARAAELPEGDIIRVLLEQHARVRELFQHVSNAEGNHKKDAFEELRGLLAVHETAEELVLRPVSADTAGKQVADARNNEEAEANKVLADLEKLDVNSEEFDRTFQAFEQAVSEHAEAEENDEFPAILSSCDEDRRKSLGRQMLAAESIAPTHPHPSTAGSTAAQFAVGPFAAIVDRTRDAIAKAAS